MTTPAPAASRRLLPLLLLLASLCCPASAQSAPASSSPGIGDRPNHTRAFPTGRSPVVARNGMACTSQPLASQVALDILQRGGSAADAAIAANAVLALVEPTGCGLGGDLFAIVWDPREDRLHGLNASGRSPRALTLEQLRATADADGLPAPLGPLSVSVPGAVSGWTALYERFGRLAWKDLFAPAIRYANEGFPVSEVIAHYWAMNFRRFAVQPEVDGLLDNAKRTFLLDGERPPGHGELFRNPDLAKTLQTIATRGSRQFYEGDLADVIDAYCQRVGCPLRKADLQAHRVEWVTPVSTTYRGYEVFELPPNGQGIAALQMLNVLEGYDLRALGHNSADYLHLHVEAKKLAFADRARFYADPAFSDVPLAGLLSKEYAASRRERIDRDRAAQDDPPGNPRLHEGDTIYLTTADSEGMMVSLIQSNYWGMGSGLVPDGLGFMLQNRGALFALDEEHANGFAPGKRPFHTIIPAFVLKDGEPWLSFGVMGGSMQPQGHAQVLCNLIDFGMNVQEAGDAPRYNHTGSSQPTGARMKDGGELALERAIPAAIRAALEAKGHRLRPAGTGSFGGYQAILRDPTTGVYHGASELRKDGHAVGF